MPENLRESIKTSKCIRYRANTGVYEVRKQINGKKYFGCSKSRSEAVRKFIESLVADPPFAVSTSPMGSTAPTAEQEQEQTKTCPLVSETCERWLELKRSEIKSVTYGYYVQLFEANILPAFLGRKIDEVKQSDVKALINEYVDQGKYRTATKIFQTLKAVFDFAVGEELIERSPMRLLKAPKYEEQNGCALTIAEERELVELVNGSKCIPEIKSALLFLLYTGIRRSELATVQISDGFVSVVCAKVRKGFQERRRLIPITPMLAEWLPAMDLDELRNVRPDALTQAMKRLMPEHHLHELRHTFITRCQECGVAREVVSVWAGHSADNTQTSKVYTHFSPEFMLREAQKVIYNLR